MEIADTVLPSGRIMRFVIAAFVGIAAAAGVILCACDALGSGAAAAASAVAAAGTLGLEQGRAVHAESERNRVSRELPAVTALDTVHHAAAATGAETVAVEPMVRHVTDSMIAQSAGGAGLEVLQKLSAAVPNLSEMSEDLSPLNPAAPAGRTMVGRFMLLKRVQITVESASAWCHPVISA